VSLYNIDLKEMDPLKFEIHYGLLETDIVELPYHELP